MAEVENNIGDVADGDLTPIKKGDIPASTPAVNHDRSHRLASATLASNVTSFAASTTYNPFKPSGALQQLSDLLCQNMKISTLSDFKGNIPTIPINDLRGDEAASYSREDCVLRRSLAALYRLIDVNGWTQSIYNHISARCSSDPRHFLINPFGLLYHEIQASSLIKIDEHGNVIDQGSTVLGISKAGWMLHSALHTARPDVNCIIHVHVPDVIAVSCIVAGLLPVSPEATELLTSVGVSYHDYHGILVNESERSLIQQDLGPTAKILFLRNHGVAVAAASIPEAWYLVKRVVTACQTQMRMLQLGGGASLLADLKENAILLANGSMKQSTTRPFTGQVVDGGLENHVEETGSSPQTNGKSASEGGEPVWSPADLEFEAQMRVLDSAGFRTGHVYQQPNLLRRANAGATWAGDTTMGDPIVAGELMTTDISGGELSGVDDVAAATAAGAEQLARISDHVKTSRQKSVQRNQWLNKNQDPNSGVVSAPLSSPDSPRFSDVHAHPSPISHTTPKASRHLFDNQDVVTTTPSRNVAAMSPTETFSTIPAVANGRPSTTVRETPPESAASVPHDATPVLTPPPTTVVTTPNKSATLPANARALDHMNARTTNTLQSADGIMVDEGDEKHKSPEKKAKKKRSFRIPSFSLKKKH